MTYTEFIEQVRLMRENEKAYDESKLGVYLIRAEKHREKVDWYLHNLKVQADDNKY